jgi:hypothetical protein
MDRLDYSAVQSAWLPAPARRDAACGKTAAGRSQQIAAHWSAVISRMFGRMAEEGGRSFFALGPVGLRSLAHRKPELAAVQTRIFNLSKGLHKRQRQPARPDHFIR